ncbi:MAG: TonB-dependent siderophore receptor, partial [Cyanobacteria bacterium J06638_38]
PRQVFEDQGAIEQRDAISRNAVGVVTGNSARSGFNDVLIRGFEESTLINGIPETFFFASVGRDLSNVERLEVLSGPASIISGNVEPGGAVNIVTKQPLLEPFYEFTASYGSFNTVEGAIDISGPLNKSKTVAYRLNASIDYSETFFDPDEVEIERFTIAPVISWQIGSQTKLTFEGLFRNSQTPQRVGIPALGTVLDNPNGEIPRDQFVGEPSFDTNTSIVGQISYDLEHDFNDNWSLRHTFRYSNFQNEQIEAFANELLDDLRTLDRTGLSAEDDIDNYQLTTYVNGKFKTGPVNHELLVGVDAVLERDVFTSEFFEIENIDIFEPEFAGGVGETTFVGTFLDSNDGVGIYLQDQIKFFDDRLIVLLGGRVDFIGADSVDDSEGTESSFNQDAFSPTAGILYKVTDNVSVYGSFSRSFEGVDGISATGEVFEASDGEQFEVGAKASWLNNRLFTTLALYDLTFSNLTTPDPENDGFNIPTW